MKSLRFLFALLLGTAVFAGGYAYARWVLGKAPTAGKRILYYVDPMHPGYTSDKPGIAPDCGMRLEPVYENVKANSKAGAGKTAAAEDGASPPGVIHISPDRQQLIGVSFGLAEFASDVASIRAVGKVAPDETRVVRIHSRVDGWIEKVHVNFTGAQVHKGDPLLTIYSPEMLATQEELLLALRARSIMQHSTLAESAEDGEALVRAARMRLELWNLSRPQIEDVERTGKPIRSITLYSPAPGFVTAKNALPNQRVTADTELYTLTDLSRIWILADVFEGDLKRIHPGQGAVVALPYDSGRSFSARVAYIQPQVDAATRTLKIRLEASNQDFTLKPDMFVNVDFRISTPPKLTVPSEAVLNSGLRKTVFIDRGEGYLDPRQVQTGDRIGDRIEILSGLKAGERVVISGNFLVDSESQLRSAAGGGMSGHSHGSAPAGKKEDMQDMPGMKASGHDQSHH
jgi:membrane fusion protein, copper/silver efflux system